MSVDSIKTPNFDLMEVLGLQPRSLCHAFTQGEWRTHQMSTRWKIQPGQRLLYRAYDLPENVCVNLQIEINRQPHYQNIKAKNIKRRGEDSVSPYSKSAKLSSSSGIYDKLYAYQPSSHCQQSVEAALQPAVTTTTYLDSYSPPAANIDAIMACTYKTYSVSTSTSMTLMQDDMEYPHKSSFPNTATLGVMQWPNDFFVLDVIQGLEAYDLNIKQGQQQQEAFKAAFGLPCVRQTLINKRRILEKACDYNEAIYDAYIAKGRVEEARWPYFEARVEGKPV
ncbi:hypothetical protein JB92DRAFT_3105188 [Gautieria morchelliformis]|nr:hypothetical protein JB92DRAFT_3105188 [Gautieria morchelliformis]